jgi:hypothetical protein
MINFYKDNRAILLLGQFPNWLFYVSGMKFAMLEMKAILSAILRRYQILPASPPHQLDLTVVLVLKSLTGVVLRLQPRNPQAATSCANEGR